MDRCCFSKENEELFWALIGVGGGNFGIVFFVEIQLIKKPKSFVWKNLKYKVTCYRSFNQLTKGIKFMYPFAI